MAKGAVRLGWPDNALKSLNKALEEDPKNFAAKLYMVISKSHSNCLNNILEK